MTLKEQLEGKVCIVCGKPAVGYRCDVVRVDDPWFNPLPVQEFVPGVITFYCEEHIK